MRGPKVEYWLAPDGKWYFHKKAGNGEVVSPSQGYKQKRYAKEAIKREHPGLPVIEIIWENR